MALMTGRHWLRLLALGVLAVVAVNGWLSREREAPAPREDRAPTAQRAPAQELPVEAYQTLQRIQRGGPFTYDRDGSVFQNREGRLPAEPRGYYREFTVPTPGSPDRGARRIVTGGDPPGVYYYTDDHYRTFRRIEVAR